MSNQPPPEQSRSSASLIALLIALAVGVVYFLNTGGLALLLPEEYNVVLTPTPVVQAEAESFAQGEAGGVQSAADAAPALEATSAPAEEPAAAAEAVTAEGNATAAPTATPTTAPTVAPTMPATINGLPTIAWNDLPPEAWDTIELIDQGGPFPYDRDGLTFQNREGLLPQERSGFYSEYTVETPGSSDRGARRIIEGQDGVLYYTDDHYDSFSVVVR